MRVGICVLVGLVFAACAAPASATPPFALWVRVHSWRHDSRALTEGYCWVHREPLGTFRPPPPDVRCVEVNRVLEIPLRYLPIRAGQSVVVRLRQPARSVAVALVSERGSRVGRRRARALAPSGRVWRLRLPGGISAARQLLVGVRYRETDTIAPRGVVTYQLSACPLAFCAQPSAGRVA